MQKQGKTKVFISYSRKNKAFVRKLNNALDAAGIDSWVDWEGIPLSSDWKAEIASAIQGGDAFLFVLSPDSIKSNYCLDELEQGINLNKKIIPILYKEPEKGQKLHPRLAATNWVYLRTKKDDFKVTLPKLIGAIQTDLGWVQLHTRYLQRAIEWEQKNRNRSYLLQGSDIEEGERWLTESTRDTARVVVPIQAEYISTSRKDAILRQRNLTIGIGAAFVLSLMLGIFAFIQRGQAIESEKKAINSQATAIANEHIAATQKAIAEEQKLIADQNAQKAKALRSASEARIFQDQAGELATSTLLAVNAFQKIPGLSEAEDVLRHNLSLLAIPVNRMEVHARIRTIQLSPDRKKFVSADSAGKACLWDLQAGTLFFCAQHDGSVLDSTFSEDGSIMITGTDRGVVTFWDSNTGKMIKSLQFDGKIFDLNLHPDGRWLGVGRTNAVSIVDMTDLKEELYFGQQGNVNTIDFDKTGTYMAMGTSEGFLSIWKVTEKKITTVSRHEGEIFDIAFSNDGNLLLSGGADSTVRATVSANGGQKYLVKHGDWVEDVTFGPDNSWYATASDDNFVRILDTQTGQERLRLAHTNFVTKVRISRDGQWIATTGYDDTVRIWDTVTGAEVMQIPIATTGADIRFSRDGTRLVVGDQAGHLSLWDISQLKERRGFLQFPEFIQEARFSPNGEWMITNSDDRNIWLIKTADLGSPDAPRRKLVSSDGLTTHIAISADSKWIAAVEYDGNGNNADFNRVILASVVEKKKHLLSHGGELIDAVTFTLDSRQVITADEKGLINFWDVDTGEKLSSLETNGVILSLAISPDGKYLVAGIEEGNRSLVWDLNTKTQLATLEQIGKINAIQFNPDGNLLATGGSGASVYLWDVHKDGTFTLSEDIFHVNGGVSTLDFSPDSNLLTVGDSTGYAYLFDLHLGQEVSRLPHIDKVTSISFSPDGKQLATVSRKAVMLWDVPSIPIFTRKDLIDIACSRMTENLDINKWKLVFLEDEYHPICPNLPAAGN
ncbi:MAG: TIR domain-containing protein [Chloroflexi bacterium]|nr:TIR domain-containing protein [Chloroflexota bacterium]